GDTAQSAEDLAVEQLIAKVGVEVLAPRSMEKAADVDRGQARKSLARRSRRSGTAPGRSACGARLHEDGRGARADRTGDRAPTAAGADEITPGCARVASAMARGCGNARTRG